MAEKTISNNSLKSLTWGMHDALVAGDVVHDIPDQMVYVNAQSELSNWTNLMPGAMAATYGFEHIWQLKPDGTWATII